MREERGTLSGNQIISEPLDLWGTISGNVTVVDGGKMYVRGAIYGHLRVAHGGRVHVYGNVSGNLTVLEGVEAEPAEEQKKEAQAEDEDEIDDDDKDVDCAKMDDRSRRQQR